MLTSGRTVEEWHEIHEAREPLRCSFGGKPLPEAGPGWDHRSRLMTLRDAWSKAYQAWCQRTGTVQGPEAIAVFHEVQAHRNDIPHSRCNFC